MNDIERHIISPECELRHRMQDELNKQIKDIHDAILGTPLSRTPSIKQKVDEIYDERNRVRKWIAGTLISIIVFIFTLGALYTEFKHVQDEITNLSARVRVLETK